MLTPEQIQSLHQLYYAERWPIRKIERHLRMGWHTIKKYLQHPNQPTVSRHRPSKLDSFKATIAELLAQDPRSAPPSSHSGCAPSAMTAATRFSAVRRRGPP